MVRAIITFKAMVVVMDRAWVMAIIDCWGYS